MSLMNSLKEKGYFFSVWYTSLIQFSVFIPEFAHLPHNY